MPTGYMLATYASPKGPRAGLVIGEKLFDAATLTGQANDATVLGILEDWDAASARLKAAAAGMEPDSRTVAVSAETDLQAPDLRRLLIQFLA